MTNLLTRAKWWPAGLLLLAVSGCNSNETPPAGSSSSAPDWKAISDRVAVESQAQNQTPPRADPSPWPDAPPKPKQERRNSLADLLQESEAEDPQRRRAPVHAASLPEIDENRIAAAGIRKLEGKHLTLYTDLPAQAAVDELPRVFDLAAKQWCAYFEIDPQEAARWRLQGYLMDRKEAFVATGLLPDDLPPFLHGFHRGQEIWLYEQPSDYYRRHLLLHEGTHGFMTSMLGGSGPPWYFEGIAELLGTHHWRDGNLKLGYFPQSKEETPLWGRIKIIQDAFAASQGLTLAKVFEMGPQAHLKVEPYGWSWGAAAFLDGHPKTQAAFRALPGSVQFGEPRFSNQLQSALKEEWPLMAEEWQLFVSNVDYGYDAAREAVVYRPGAALPPSGQNVIVAADRGWQSSGVLVEQGKSYRITAEGRYTVAQEPRPWECEPNGVTLRYYRGRPLGILLGTVRGNDFKEGDVSALLRPGVIGTERTIRAPTTGVLYLRINDSPAELSDNAGTLRVHVSAARD